MLLESMEGRCLVLAAEAPFVLPDLRGLSMAVGETYCHLMWGRPC